MSLCVVVEGDTDLPIVRKLAADAGLPIALELDAAGKGDIDANLDGYNNASRGSPWFVLRDLDHDAPCAPEYLRGLGFEPAPWMCFRIAVREMEAWCLADVQGLSAYLKVRPSLFPEHPELEPDPTRTIVNLSRRSTSNAIRRAMVPKPGATAAVGPLYEAKLIEFCERHWNLDRAVHRSASLARTRTALRSLGARWRAFVKA